MSEHIKQYIQEYLFNLKGRGIKLGLDRMKKLLELLGNPQDKFRSVHIAGTNGKGSTSALVFSILKEAGYKTGLLTSPHLVHYNERITVNNDEISDFDIEQSLRKIVPHIENLNLSFFEVTTALAYLHFLRKEVDFAVLEVGLGGRLDATNILNPEVSVITNISKEHTKSLGNTIKKIAGEKACIIKPGTPVVGGNLSHTPERVVAEVARNNGSEFFPIRKYVEYEYIGIEGKYMIARFGERFPEQRIGLIGSHQLENASAAILVADILNQRGFNINDRAISKGLENVRWKGRFDIISKDAESFPLIVIDAAHNIAGMENLVASIRSYYPGKKVLFMVGILADKKYYQMIKTAGTISNDFIFVTPDSERATPLEEYDRIGKRLGLSYELNSSVADGFCNARNRLGDYDILCVCGSLFTIGEVYGFMEKEAELSGKSAD